MEDPARMIPHLLDGDAIRGTVASLTETKVVVNVRAVRRMVIALDSPDPVILPAGKRLWWTATAGGHPWEVQSVQPNGAGSRVVLMLTAKPTSERLPVVGDVITLSTLCTGQASFLADAAGEPAVDSPAGHAATPFPSPSITATSSSLPCRSTPLPWTIRGGTRDRGG